jgi:hypothetical protein
LRLADIDVVDSQIVKQAIDLVQTHSDLWLFNHVMRSWLFATRIAERTHPETDPELLALAAVLHDLGLTANFSKQNRFEVDGANAAREFLRGHGLKTEHIQLVWDAIALHTTRSIALYKQPEVAMCQSGIAADIIGLGLDLIAPQDIAAILAAYPRLSMKGELKTCLCEVIRRKPDSSYDNFLRDMGERYIEGYAPPSFADFLERAPFDE